MPGHQADNPRGYIRSQTLPIPSDKGIKIQARTSHFYNPTLPKREEIRKKNYDRRYAQRTEQGFNSANYKPYQGIGDPFFLSERKLILSALGQWSDEEDEEYSTSSEDDNTNEEDPLASDNNPNLATAKFLLRRTKKKLNTLPKEMAHGRSMMKNVRLGHGLFYMINKERHDKIIAIEKERRRLDDIARASWQAPRYDSSSDETDEDLAESVDLRSYMVTPFDDRTLDSPSPPPYSNHSPDKHSRVNFSGLDGPSRGVSAAVSGRSGHSSKKKKQLNPSRPYTPQHNLIGTETEESPAKEPLFRQLCILNWLLEAMQTEPPIAMGPISRSWNLKEIGGTKTTVKRLQKEKSNETKWEAWVNNQSIGKISKRFSKTSPHKLKKAPSNLHARQGSVTTSTSNSPHGSMSQLSMSRAASNQSLMQAPSSPGINNKQHEITDIPEHGEVSRDVTIEKQPVEEEEVGGGGYAKGLFKFLDDYYATMRLEESKAKGGADITEDSQSLTIHDNTTISHDGANSPKKKKHRIRAKSENKKTADNTFHLEDAAEERMRRIMERSIKEDTMSVNNLRASRFIRPKSSPALVEFQNNALSNKYGSMALNMRQQFSEVHEEKAVVLHDELEHRERQRLKVCQNKYVSLSSKGLGLHRMLEDMRARSATLMERPDEKKNKKRSDHQAWYVDLQLHMPEDANQYWYFHKIMEKLAKFAALESGSQQGTYKFLKVLAALRHWEILNPDISAAIEFCREKIIQMPIEEYEEWFRSQFPTIERPQTAPPSIKGDTKQREHSHQREKSAR
ncbi:unnamed protein product [Owenia fusiformis]|uniref:Coiled-coil domain-containing protein 60 n=1 Tax=Owenia fusiformis TaxID=6347 RepID=A0A8S4MXL5_OWEFU|nr:unnamed protein product [Owenia fusiformis]